MDNLRCGRLYLLKNGKRFEVYSSNAKIYGKYFNKKLAQKRKKQVENSSKNKFSIDEMLSDNSMVFTH